MICFLHIDILFVSVFFEGLAGMGQESTRMNGREHDTVCTCKETECAPHFRSAFGLLLFFLFGAQKPIHLFDTFDLLLRKQN